MYCISFFSKASYSLRNLFFYAELLIFSLFFRWIPCNGDTWYFTNIKFTNQIITILQVKNQISPVKTFQKLVDW